MTTYNTGNPLGSTDPRDLYDNAENLDVAVNSDGDTFQDRLGKSRLTWAGMENQFRSDQSSREQEFLAFIASSGYQFAGDYAAGIEITQYNQIIRDSNGEFWRVSGRVDLPYVTTGTGLPEDDAFVPAGDAVLRQDLANPDKGAAMVARAPVVVNTVSEMLGLVNIKVGSVVQTKGHNSPGDGGHGEFIAVDSSETIGIAHATNSTIKFQRIAGQDQWKIQYAGKTPKFVSHRGGAGYTEKNLYFVPENTIYSARRSAEAGFWGLESDAKISSDGVLFVFHDTTVDRTITGESGSFNSFTAAQIRNFDAGTYVSNIYTNARVMDYNDWFKSCRKYGLVPCAEVSVGLTDAQADQFIADCLQYYPDGVGVFLQSTNINTLRKIRARNANITLYRSFSYGSVPPVSGLDEMYELGNAGVHFSGAALDTDPTRVQDAKDRGLCLSYAIANTEELIVKARDLGIHRIMTDFIPGDY